MVRKWLGHDHTPRHFAPQVKAFAQGVLTPYLNYHHPCLFATEARDRQRDVATPYEKLQCLPDAERFLKPGVTFAELDKVAFAMSDLEANRARDDATSCSGPSAVLCPRRA